MSERRRSNKKVLARVSFEGGEISEQTFSGDNLWTFAPDGKQIAYVFYDEQNKQYKVGIRPLGQSEPAVVFNISPINFLLWTKDGKICFTAQQNRAQPQTRPSGCNPYRAASRNLF